MEVMRKEVFELEKKRVVLEINNPTEFFDNIGEYENLILNLMSGLEIDDLSENEIQILKSKHGENWRIELGYE